MALHVLTPSQQRALQLQLTTPRSDQPQFHSPQSNMHNQLASPLSPSHPDLQLPTSPHARPQSLQSPGPVSPTNSPLSYVESMLLLTRGEEMTKYAARGSFIRALGPSCERRYVFYDKERDSMGTLYWCKPGQRIKDPKRAIPLSRISGLYEQAETEAFGTKLTPEQRNRCFSVVCADLKDRAGKVVAKGRTLDLMADTVDSRNTWMHCIHQILIHSGYNVRELGGDSAMPGETAPGSEATSPGSASRQAMEAAAELDRGGVPKPFVRKPSLEEKKQQQQQPSEEKEASSDPNAPRLRMMVTSPQSASGATASCSALTPVPIQSPESVMPRSTSHRAQAAEDGSEPVPLYRATDAERVGEGEVEDMLRAFVQRDAQQQQRFLQPQQMGQRSGMESTLNSPASAASSMEAQPVCDKIDEHDAEAEVEPQQAEHQTEQQAETDVTARPEAEEVSEKEDQSGAVAPQKDDEPADAECKPELATMVTVMVQGPLPATEPDAILYDDPLAAAKLIQSLSPTSSAQLGLPQDVTREIPATLSVPLAAEVAAAQLLSPSEHPTLTPHCSPIVPDSKAPIEA